MPVAAAALGETLRQFEQYKAVPVPGRARLETPHDPPAYDTSHAAPAERLDAPLVTLDARLGRTSGPCCQTLTAARGRHDGHHCDVISIPERIHCRLVVRRAVCTRGVVAGRGDRQTQRPEV